MADGDSTHAKDGSVPLDPEEGTSKDTGQQKKQSLTPQETEAIIDGLFKRFRESGVIPPQPKASETPPNTGQCLIYQPVKAGSFQHSKHVIHSEQ